MSLMELPLMFIGIVAAGVGIILFLRWLSERRSGKEMPNRRSWVVGIGCVFLACAASGAGRYFGMLAFEAEEKAARAFVAELGPQLTVYFNEHGKYPETLEVVGAKLPKNERSRLSYESGRKSFRFSYHSAGQFLRGWEYTSDSRAWERD
jgi:hypothetical protein